MRNVAKRMKYGELAAGIIIWHENQVNEKRALEAKERGQRMMKRVGGRWANREMSDAFREWCDKWTEDKNRTRAEAIMRRVGGRWRNKDLALNWTEWVRNWKDDTSHAWLAQRDRLQLEIDALKLKFQLVTQVGTDECSCPSL